MDHQNGSRLEIVFYNVPREKFWHIHNEKCVPLASHACLSVRPSIRPDIIT